MKPLLTTLLLNLALTSCGSYSALRQTNFESPSQQEAYQDLRRQARGNIEELMRCGAEDDEKVAQEARQAALERAMKRAGEEGIEEWYKLSSGIILILSREGQLYQTSSQDSRVGYSEDRTQKCQVYLPPKKMEPLTGGEEEFEQRIGAEMKHYRGLYHRWEDFKKRWDKASASGKAKEELQPRLLLWEFVLENYRDRAEGELEMLSPRRYGLVETAKEAQQRIQLYLQEVESMKYEMEQLKIKPEEKPRKSLPKYVRTC